MLGLPLHSANTGLFELVLGDLYAIGIGITARTVSGENFHSPKDVVPTLHKHTLNRIP